MSPQQYLNTEYKWTQRFNTLLLSIIAFFSVNLFNEFQEVKKSVNKHDKALDMHEQRLTWLEHANSFRVSAKVR